MTIRDFWLYLFGQRQAILRIANAPGALWLSGLFVFSAALAREYDQVDLTREPWRLLVPFGASLVTSYFLYVLFWFLARRKSDASLPFLSGYRRFLTLYWMTAPLAWLYGLPVERFFSVTDATKVNLVLLGIVSLWRVVLMIRVAGVFFGAGEAATWPVLFFADSVALIVLFMTPLPIFNIMGGVPLTASEELIQCTALIVGAVCFLSWPVWFCGTVAIGFTRGRWIGPTEIGATNERVSSGLWGLAATAILLGAVALPWTQREKRLRREVDKAPLSNRIVEAEAHLEKADSSRARRRVFEVD